MPRVPASLPRHLRPQLNQAADGFILGRYPLVVGSEKILAAWCSVRLTSFFTG